MSDEAKTEDGEEKPKGKLGLIMVPLLVLISAGAGFAVPMMMGGSSEPEPEKDPLAIEIPDPIGKAAFVDFGEVVGNLNDGRMNRFLRLHISLQIDEAQLLKIEEIHEKQKAVLRNWLLSHISDKSMDDIRGASGQNRLRREIKEQFNAVLFPDGVDRVHDVLFQEFNVQ
ncbi:MAG: flagellar basal body-associated protein FliL [Planctomycetaceae bacterium]